MPTLRRLRALVVGGGAVGQVVGHHLRQAGVELGYLLKPEYAVRAEEEGWDLHPLARFGRRRAVHLQDFKVFTRIEAMIGEHWDYVFICVPDPALRQGNWLDRLGPFVEEATIVALQPGLRAREYLVGCFPSDRVVSGMVGFVAYPAPLPGEDLWPEGTAFWQPPLSPSVFSGPMERTAAAVELLQKGGFAAAHVKDASQESAFGSAALIPFIVAIESFDWSMKELLSDNANVEMLCGAVAEAQAAVSKKVGDTPGLSGFFSKPPLFRIAAKLAPKVVAFPLEPYLALHFTKLREQTEHMMESFIDLADEVGTGYDKLRILQDHWMTRRKVILRDREDTPVPRDREITPLPGEVPAVDGPVVMTKRAESDAVVPVVVNKGDAAEDAAKAVRHSLFPSAKSSLEETTDWPDDAEDGLAETTDWPDDADAGPADTIPPAVSTRSEQITEDVPAVKRDEAVPAQIELDDPVTEDVPVEDDAAQDEAVEAEAGAPPSVETDSDEDRITEDLPATPRPVDVTPDAETEPVPKKLKLDKLRKKLAQNSGQKRLVPDPAKLKAARPQNKTEDVATPGSDSADESEA